MRGAFTLIELLMVISILAVLAALTVASANALGVGSKKVATANIIAKVRSGLDQAIAIRGTALAAAEHPLAGSRPGRALFRGLRGRVWNAAAKQASGGTMTDLNRDAEALSLANEWAVAGADANRVLMADDHFVDVSVPGLYGLTRASLHVLGAENQAVTRHRQLVHPKAESGPIPGPYDSSAFPDARCLIAPGGASDASRAALDYLFAGSDALTELAALKAVVTPPDDDAANRIRPPTAIGGLDNGGRVWTPDANGGEEQWKAGRIQDGTLPNGKPAWKRYSLRGASLVDAWGRELLAWPDLNGAMHVVSAGYDGCFHFAPGNDRTFATGVDAEVPAGDDKDGRRDNVGEEGR
jgi:prepilin-type N-terminal cleavage/methylation domain-containing protein